MKKSEFREFVKEMFIELMENDEEVREIVLEFVQQNTNVLTESKITKEPEDPELYDKLMMIASGQEKKLVHEGKIIRSPNYGNGFKSGKHIKEWATKTYSDIGGGWIAERHLSESENFGVRNDTLSFLSSMGGSDNGSLRNIASLGNDKFIKENIIKTGRNQMMALDEHGNFDPGKNIDISDVLVDTAKTTLQRFPTSHDKKINTGPSSQESFQGTPEQVFGESAGNWAALAFQGMNLGE
jgi:hypothetical protein